MGKNWTPSEVENLINFYENKPELWNVKCVEFKDRVRKSYAWKELSEKLNVTVEEIQRKIHNIRNQFNSELKKSLKRKSGDGANATYTSKWIHFKQMMFLKSSLLSRSSSGNLQDNLSEHSEDGIEQNVGELNDILNTGYDNSEKDKNQPAIEPIKNRSKSTGREPENEILMQRAIRTLNEPDDEYDIFGKYVASEMRNVSHKILKIRMKRKIQEIIMETQQEEERLLLEQFSPVSTQSSQSSVSASNLNTTINYEDCNVNLPACDPLKLYI